MGIGIPSPGPGKPSSNVRRRKGIQQVSGDFLAEILALKKLTRQGAEHAVQLPGSAPARRPFADAIRGKGRISLIAEAKKASPSAGVLREHYDPAMLAAAYETAGASAVSVVTEEAFFGGSLNHLGLAREACGLPVLRKDFLCRPEEVEESRGAGADAVLLIAAMMDGPLLREMLAAAACEGLEALVEARTEAEINLALESGAGIIGINNRDLRTLEVDRSAAERLLPLVPSGVVAVAESGISTREQMLRAEDLGAEAALVGSALVSAADPCAAALVLLGAQKGGADAEGRGN